MIDGVKLLCNLNPTDWTNNKNLSFRSWIDEATGEIPNKNKHANIDGLHLAIKQTDKETFCNLRGSLPKYYTKGDTNANDYDFSDFLTTCEKLRDTLKIEPKTALLRGFEFGVNINLPFDFANILECIKSYKMHICGINEIDGKRNGVRFDFQQYRIKIYDKGLQITGRKSRLMRFEISVKKMIWLKQLGIKTLSDLQSPAVWAELAKILCTVWNDIIFIEKGLKYRLMSNHEQKKYLYYFNIHYWANLNRNCYHKAKNHLEKLQTIYKGKADTKQIILNLIGEKCVKLATVNPAEIGDNLTTLKAPKSTPENSENGQHLKNDFWRQFNPLDKRLNTVNNFPTISPENIPENIRNNYNNKTNEKKAKKTKIKNCMNCKTSLKEKKPTAKFCGLKCKNHYNGKRRTRERQNRRNIEQRELKKIIPKLPALNLSLLVIYKADGLQYADHLKQCEIKAPPDFIRTIRRVLITDDKTAPPLEFTTLRAKKLIRQIAKINSKISQNENTNI